MIHAAIWLKDARDKKQLMGEYEFLDAEFKRLKEDWLKWLADGDPKGGAYKCQLARTSTAQKVVPKEILLDFSAIAAVG